MGVLTQHTQHSGLSQVTPKATIGGAWEVQRFAMSFQDANCMSQQSGGAASGWLSGTRSAQTYTVQVWHEGEQHAVVAPHKTEGGLAVLRTYLLHGMQASPAKR